MKSCFGLFLLIFIPFLAPCQQTDIGADAKMNRFYISGISDSRTNKTIDKLPISGVSKSTSNDSLVKLEQAILFLINREIQADTSLIPINIDIRKFEINEKPVNSFPGREFKLLFNYQLQANGQQIEFAFFSFKQDIYKYVNAPAHYVDIFRKELPEMIRQLNSYIDSTKSNFPYKGITVKSTILNKISRDTIFYNSLQKLSWNDFKAKPDRNSIASALTTSSFSYYSQSNISDGYLTVDVILQCYFLSRKSWLRSNVNSGAVLDHEQLHFDITYLWARKLLTAINTHKFPAIGWQYELEKLKAAFFDEMAAMQEEYDRESDYGRNPEKQTAWRSRVDDLLSESLL